MARRLYIAAAMALLAGCQTMPPRASVAPLDVGVVEFAATDANASEARPASSAVTTPAASSIRLTSAEFASQPELAPEGSDEAGPFRAAEVDPVPKPRPEPQDRESTVTGDENSSPANPGAATSVMKQPDPAGHVVGLGDVLSSVYAHYPLLDAAFSDRMITAGYQLAAEGEFDTKLKGASDNQPLYFYENYIQKVSVEQPLYNGGQVFGQYRIGRGSFEPWYLERETNKGGEFRAGIVVPLLQGLDTDARRTELLKAGLERASVEPGIRRQLLEFSQAAAYAYWEWLAAGQYFIIAETLLKNAELRAEAVRRRVEEGDLEPIAAAENERLVLSRKATLLEAERKLISAGIKLSLFLRDVSGQPYYPDASELPRNFPAPRELPPEETVAATERALAIRPELQELAFERRQASADLQWARNQRLPNLDAGIVGAQDVGEATSPKRDKSEFELEVGLALETPLQFRKARGYTAVAEGKIAQLNAKTRFTRDKIATEVRTAAVAVAASYRRYEQVAQSLELARQLEDADRRRFEEGEIDLFALNLREQQTADAAASVVTAQLDYYRSLADFCAALGEFPATQSTTAGVSPPPAPSPVPPGPTDSSSSSLADPTDR